MFDKIRYDLRSIKERDPAARNCAEVFFLYSGFHAVFWYRLSHFFYRHKLLFLARLVSQLTNGLPASKSIPAPPLAGDCLLTTAPGW